MNIDRKILSMLKYLRGQFIDCVYTINTKSTYDPTTDIYLNTTTNKDLKCIPQFEKIYHIEDSKIEVNECLVLLYGKIDFQPKKDDTLVANSITYIVQRIELNISKRAVILNVCR